VFFLAFAACSNQSPKQALLTPAEHLQYWDTITRYRIDTLPENEEEASDGGSEILFYSLNGRLMKIKAAVGLSWGNMTSTYYCNGDSLLAFSEMQQSFPSNGDSLDFTKLVHNYTGILIFQSDTVSQHSSEGTEMLSRDPEALGRQILEEFTDLAEEFKSQKSKIKNQNP